MKLTERTARRSGADAPWPVMALVVIEVLGSVAWMLLGGSLPRGITGFVIGGVIALGILFGNRGAWVVAVFFAAFSLIGAINLVIQLVAGYGLTPDHWSALATYVVSTALLLHPLTRAWASR